MRFNQILLIASFLVLIILNLNQLRILFRLKGIIKLERPNDTSNANVTISKLEFQTLDGGHFLLEQVKSSSALILMYFDPTCEECLKMIDRIFFHPIEFSNAQIIIVTESNITQAIQFSKDYKLSKYQNINIVLDRNEIMYRKFNLLETPSFVILNRDYELVKVIDEFVSFPILVKYVRKVTKKSH